MNLSDFLIPPPEISTEDGFIGSFIQKKLPENGGGVALIFIGDYRGINIGIKQAAFIEIRKSLYQLSASDWVFPLVDLGDVVAGKTPEDTHEAIIQVVSTCLYANVIPIIIGGGMDFSIPILEANCLHKKKIEYSLITPKFSLEKKENIGNNYLAKAIVHRNIHFSKLHLLGYQKQLIKNEDASSLQNIKTEGFSLGNILANPYGIEPFCRKSNTIILDTAIIEGSNDPFAMETFLHGLNRREACIVAQEIGLSEQVNCIGLLNFNYETESEINIQLLSQIIWHILDGINTRNSHPKEKKYETYFVMINEEKHTFKKEIFTGLWYFGNSDNLNQCIPCAKSDYQLAKEGIINPRLLKGL